ncbi:S8 family serine peptidase [Nocardioides antri]|uniref:S8 family serine peptidase n=1 Tax=Nocardioides antri TaxID=2607659 RepID=A0A5B1LWT1_9ACTN|nr:S8 family serine peptidase [Nocardioides antri]KAA1424047.1 S8 family serine peptidase [Nocardioides antri]
MSDSPRPSFSLRDLLSKIRRRFPWPPIKPPITAPDQDRLARDRARAQVDVIRKAFAKAFGDDVAVAGPEGPRRAEDDADVKYLYHPRRLLVRDGDDFEALTRFFTDPDRHEMFEGEPRRVSEPVPGKLVVVEVPVRRDGADDVLATLDDIDEAFPERAERREPLAAPDHVLYVTAVGKLCPETEPEVPRGLDPVPPRATDESAGAEVRVAVVDTGWWKAAATHPATDWISDVTSDPEDEEVLAGSTIHEYAGHGTFVAGVVKCVAPKARVEIEGALTHGGAVYESQICEQLQEALHDNDLPQIVSISAGTHTRNNMGLLGLEILAAHKGLDDGVKTIVVAAAGNDETDDEFYPAAYPWVIGVGSVDPDGKRSDFSNYGKWVKAYARGRDLVNAFPKGTYTCHYPENKDPVTGAPDVRQFDGLARWSGTSFATPIVAGAIAAHMSATGNLVEPWRAWQELSTAAPAGPDGTPLIGPL